MTVRTPVYLDHHATTPVDPRVLEAMLPYFTEQFGNAASIDHAFGHTAEQAVENARTDVAKLIGARPGEIFFTSGATEADNLALFGVMDAYSETGDHLITCVTEHKAVLDSARRLESIGKRVTYLSVDREGRVDLDDLRRAITDRTVLISIMAANNEIGTLASLAEIGRIAHEHGVLFHTDATQAAGYVPIDVGAMQIDLLSLSSHKMYGPKGAGALYVRRRQPFVKVTPIIWGGGHERGLRSGTLNVPGIVGLAMAASLARETMVKESHRLQMLTDAMFSALSASLPDIERNGPSEPSIRLPHNLSIYLPGVESKALVLALPDLAFSTGAACSTAEVKPSHVIQSLGYGTERAHGTIRIGLGRPTTEEQTTYASGRLVEEIWRLRKVRRY